MDTDVLKGIKRKSSSSKQIKSSKRKQSSANVNILELSDCTLLNVLKFLDATSLYQLGQTCNRFKLLVQDESLWIHVDGRKPPNDIAKTSFCWENVTQKTKHILLAAKKRSEVVISVEVLILSKNLNNLTILALEHQQIKYCKLKEFPRTLQELSLRHSYIPNHTDFFRFAQEAMINLKVLLLDHCQWFESGSLMSISRYPQLEILSLYMCKKLGDDDISSVSVVGKFGFRNLKVIDLRFTGLGDLFFKTFYRNSTLQIIYFQSFPSTYHIERLKRKLDLINGEHMRKDGYLSDDEANNDFSRRSFRKRFKTRNLVASDSQTIDDDTMLIFNRLRPTGCHLARPKSVLYTYPYDKCTCGFFDEKLGTYGPVEFSRCDNEEEYYTEPGYVPNNNNVKSHFSSGSDSSDNDDNDDDWDINSLQRKLEYEIKYQKGNIKRNRKRPVYFLQPDSAKICHQLIHNSCTLPAWCQARSTSKTGIQKWLYVREPRNDYEISMLEHTHKHFKVRSPRRCGTRGRDSECGPCVDDKNVIIISRNETGGLIQITTPGCPSANILENSKQLSKEVVINFIKEISQVLGNINQQTNNESFINEILATFDDCLKTEEFFKYADDSNFVQDLWVGVSLMARCINQNIERVLKYHFICFHDLLNCLADDQDVGNRKNMLISFFKNLSSNEGSEDLPKDPKDKPENPHSDENWNLPGTSGLQSKKRKRTETKNKKKQIDNKYDSDSDTNTENLNIKVFNGLPLPLFMADHACVFEKKLKSKLEKYPHKRRKVDYIEMPMPSQRGDVQLQQGTVNQLPPLVLPDYFVHVLAPVNPRLIPTNIKELSLRGYQITDRTLVLLKEMELELLDVTGTNVTFAAVQQFMMSNPQCRLIHEFACVCRPKLHF